MRIESVGVALPERRMTTEEVVAGCRLALDYPVAAWTGIQEHRRAGEHEFALQLAERAIANSFARSCYRPSEIELVINCNISRVDAPGRFSYEPATASRLAARAGLHAALTFDITNACAGMFTGLALAADFLASGRARRALVVSGEYITHLSDTAQREIEQQGYSDPALACLTLGDAGAAVILDAVDAEMGVGFEFIDIVTLSRYCRLCVSAPTYKAEGGALMRTDSQRLGMVATRESVRHLKAVMDRLGQRPRDYQHVLPHQTSIATLNTAMRAANEVFGPDEINEGNLIVNLGERGNTASTSHFVALWDQIQRGRIRSGERILFSTVASGLAVGLGPYTLDDLPERLLRQSYTGLTRTESQAGSISRWSTRSEHYGCVRFESIGVTGNLPGQADTFALAHAGAEAALRGSKYGRKDFSHLVFIGMHRTDWMSEPAVSTFVAASLRMNEAWTDDRGTLAFDLTHGATGFLTTCEVARQLLSVQPERRVLISTAELDPNLKAGSDISLGIAPSGAGVVVDASPDPGRGLGGMVIHRLPEHVDTWTSDLFFGGPITQQVSAGVEDALPVLIDAAAGALQELLELENLTWADVNAVLAAEVAPGFRARLGDALHLNPRQLIDPPGERLHRSTCSLPYLLRWALDNGALKAGDISVLIEAGSGLQVACAIYRV